MRKAMRNLKDKINATDNLPETFKRRAFARHRQKRMVSSYDFNGFKP
jgi:hypothetical protein